MNLHIYPSTFQYESRILKETKTLSDAGMFERIVIAAMHAPGLARQEKIDSAREVWRLRGLCAERRGIVAKILRHITWMALVLWACVGKRVHCVNCHALSVAPLALVFKLFWRATLVYDAHELETETLSMKGARRFGAKILERIAIRWMDRVIVVSDSIADWYQRSYQHPQIHIVKNAPVEREVAAGGPIRLKQRLGIAESHTLFLYQGLLHRGRNIELLLEAFSRAPVDKHVLFLGYGTLEELVRRYASDRPNIHYHPAVPPAFVTSYTACADVGLCLIEDCCLSYRYSMPNKLFECLGTGIPVMVSNLPDMAALVRQHQCGWVVENSAAALLELITRLQTDEIQRKRLAVRACGRIFLWEQQAPKLLDAYANLRVAA